MFPRMMKIVFGSLHRRQYRFVAVCKGDNRTEIGNLVLASNHNIQGQVFSRNPVLLDIRKIIGSKNRAVRSNDDLLAIEPGFINISLDHHFSDETVEIDNRRKK